LTKMELLEKQPIFDLKKTKYLTIYRKTGACHSK